MSTITKTTLIAALLLGLAPAAYARDSGTDLPRSGWPIEQQHVYSANTGWSDPNSAANAYAHQPRGRVTPGTVRPHRVIKDDPPGASRQDRGIREDLGTPGYLHFAVAKAGWRVIAQSTAPEYGPRDLHVAPVAIDGLYSDSSARGSVPSRSAFRINAPVRALYAGRSVGGVKRVMAARSVLA